MTTEFSFLGTIPKYLWCRQWCK